MSDFDFDRWGKYIEGLKPGERVVETSNTFMKGCEGVVYLSDEGMSKGCTCVMWESKELLGGNMGTSVTWGTRRIADKDLE